MSDFNSLFSILESRDRLVRRLHIDAASSAMLISEHARLETELKRLGSRIDELQALVKATEDNRDYWKAQAEGLAPRIDELQALVKATEDDRDCWRERMASLAAELEESKKHGAQDAALIGRLERNADSDAIRYDELRRQLDSVPKVILSLFTKTGNR
jgi:chromosome segregation ATPase